MADATNAPTEPMVAPVTCAGVLCQRDPTIFTGTGEHDVKDSLSSYDGVSTQNKWDDQSKLTNIIFYLADVANLWFKNHERDILSWSTFKTHFIEMFGRPAVRKLHAEQRLSQRAQQPGETAASSRGNSPSSPIRTARSRLRAKTENTRRVCSITTGINK